MMKISETKLSSVIFILAAIALLTSWSLCAVIQQCGFKFNSNLKNPTHSAMEFLLINFVIAAVFLSSSLKPSASDGKVDGEIHMQCIAAEIEERKNDDDDDDDNDVDSCSVDDECAGSSECCEDDDIDPADLEKRADEFIAKMTQVWMEERMKQKLSNALSMKSS